MNMISTISVGRCDALVEALRAEFGSLQAERILEAEACDFLWEARVYERYVGQHFAFGIGDEERGCELSRVAVLSSLAGRWFVGMCLVDGEGCAVDLLWRRTFEAAEPAKIAFAEAR